MTLMFNKKQLLLFGVVIFFLFLSMLMTPRVSAISEQEGRDATMRWVDRAHIEVTAGDETFVFFDNDIGDGDNQFLIQDYSCTSGNAGDIELNDGNIHQVDLTTGNLDLDIIPDGNTECVDLGGGVDKPIASASNAYKVFGWASPTRIVRVDGNGNWTFTQSQEFPELFLRDSENGDTCQDRLVVSGNTYKIYEIHSSGFGDPLPNEARAAGCRYANGQDSSVFIRNTAPPQSEQLAGTPDNPIDNVPGSGGGGEGADDTPSCENQGGALAWILCSVIRAMDNGLRWIDRQIERLLDIDSATYENEEIKQAAAIIRNIAYIILIPIMLVMVIGTALGFELISAYTIKRALPRLFAAVIFMALSYSITTFLIQFANVLGAGVMGLLTAPFIESGADLTLDNLFAPELFESIIASAAIAAVIIAMFVFWAPLLLFAAIAFLVLILRQMLIVALLLIAPLAILAWIFPGNDKLWKSWWSLFSKLLLMFPIIMGLIAMGRIFAFIINTGEIESTPGVPGGNFTQDNVVTPILVVVAYILPYAFIPFVFKAIGGLISTVTGGLQNRSGGLLKRASDRRARGFANLNEKRRAGKLIPGARGGEGAGRYGRIAHGLNRRIARASNFKKGDLLKSRADRQASITGRHDAASLAWGLKEAEDPARASSFASDDTMMAALRSGGDVDAAYQHLVNLRDADNNRVYSDDEARIMANDGVEQWRHLGSSAEAVFLAKLPATGTAYQERYEAQADGTVRHVTSEEAIGEWLQDLDRVTGGNGSLRATLVAAGKSGFRSAQRYEVSEAGFGNVMAASRAIGQDGADVDAIVRDLTDNANRSGGPAAVIGSRNAASAGVHVRRMNERIDAARTARVEAQNDFTVAETEYNNNQTLDNQRTLELARARLDEAHQNYTREMAFGGAVHQSIGQAKQIVSDVVGQEFLGRQNNIEMPGQRVEVEVPVTVTPRVETVETPTGVLGPNGQALTRTESVTRYFRDDTNEEVPAEPDGSAPVVHRTETRVSPPEVRSVNLVQEVQRLSLDPSYQQHLNTYQNALDSDTAERARQQAQMGANTPGTMGPGTGLPPVGGGGPGQI